MWYCLLPAQIDMSCIGFGRSVGRSSALWEIIAKTRIRLENFVSNGGGSFAGIAGNISIKHDLGVRTINTDTKPEKLSQLIAQLNAEGVHDYRRYEAVRKFLNFKARDKGIPISGSLS